MNETPDEHNAKPTFAVKYEESLELLKAFLMIKDPRFRAEIISIVKETACDQPEKEDYFFRKRQTILSRTRFGRFDHDRSASVTTTIEVSSGSAAI
jgi:hypothetical protein